MPSTTIGFRAEVTGMRSGRAEPSAPAIALTGTPTLQNVDCSIGDTTITCPAGARVLIVFPTSGTGTIKLKGVAGDTGIDIRGPGDWMFIPLAAAETQIVLTVAVADVNDVEVWSFL